MPPEAEESATNQTVENSLPDQNLKNSWSIRECFLYKEEYSDCRSFKARFHQYFIFGKSIDCEQWKIDYDNCVLYEEKKDLNAGRAVIESEAKRRLERQKAHFANNVWKRRSSPPDDWSKPLPEWLVKKNENTLLDLKAKELKDPHLKAAENENSYCSIM